MSKVKQIIRLRKQGTPLQTIAKGIGISRNTVKKYLQLIEVKGSSFDELLEKTDEELEVFFFEPDQRSQVRIDSLQEMFPYMGKELRRTGVNRWILWGEYKEKHPDGFSYAHFCHCFRQWLQTKQATMHFEHHPAEKMYLDFTGQKMHWADRDTGEVYDAEVFVAIMGYSQLLYVQATASQKKEDFLDATENALHYYQGVPRALVPDNLKSAVHKTNKYEAELNADFADFANHYSTCVLPARSYKPRDKALVEKAVQIVYSGIFAPLRNRVFYSLNELNEVIAQRLEVVNSQHFQKMPVSRRQMFDQEEKHLLLPLATERYEIKHFKHMQVMKNCHVHLSDDKHYYSVPYRFISKKVKLIWSASRVAIFCKNERIAFHKRDTKRFAYTTLKEHLPSTHQFVSDWNPEKFLSWAEGIDPVVKEYISVILESKSFPEQAYRSCVGILSHDKKAGRERLINAVKRAIHYGVYNYKIIDRILKGGLDRLVQDRLPDKQASLPLHENIRGANEYK